MLVLQDGGELCCLPRLVNTKKKKKRTENVINSLIAV